MKCEYCMKRKAVKQRATGLIVCQQCDDELNTEVEKE